MSEQHFLGKINTKAVIVKDGKVLIGRAHRDQLWNLPGGRVNVGESLEQAVKREVQEELGVEATIGKMFFSEDTTHTTDPAAHMYIGFEVQLVDENPQFKIPSEEWEEVKWIEQGDLDKLEIYQNIRRILQAYWQQKA